MQEVGGGIMAAEERDKPKEYEEDRPFDALSGFTHVVGDVAGDTWPVTRGRWEPQAFMTFMELALSFQQSVLLLSSHTLNP